MAENENPPPPPPPPPAEPPPAEPPPAVESAAEIESLRSRVASLEQDLHNHKLLLADFENARKRLLRDVEAERKYASETLLRDLLGTLDNLNRALDAARSAGDNGPLVTGVAATAAQMLATLAKHGVTRIECGPGTVFDPKLHEAVSQQPSQEHAPGHIVQVLQHGYLFHDRVLRPVAVVVSASE